MDHSEAAARARTRTIPDGTYEAESFMDDDGVDVGKRVPIKVKVIGQGRRDDDRPHRCRRSRCGASTIPAPPPAIACAQVAYKCLTSPTDYPINDGSFRSLNVDRAAGPRRQRGAARADAAGG